MNCIILDDTEKAKKDYGGKTDEQNHEIVFPWPEQLTKLKVEAVLIEAAGGGGGGGGGAGKQCNLESNAVPSGSGGYGVHPFLTPVRVVPDMFIAIGFGGPGGKYGALRHPGENGHDGYPTRIYTQDKKLSIIFPGARGGLGGGRYSDFPKGLSAQGILYIAGGFGQAPGDSTIAFSGGNAGSAAGNVPGGGGGGASLYANGGRGETGGGGETASGGNATLAAGGGGGGAGGQDAADAGENGGKGGTGFVRIYYLG